MANAIPQNKLQVIKDNPNLATSVLARFLGIDKATVRKAKKENGGSVHSFKGNNIPHLTSEMYNGGFRYVVIYRGRKLGVGSFDYCMEQLDRLLFCLEHNDGKLPPTSLEGVFDNLEHVK